MKSVYSYILVVAAVATMMALPPQVDAARALRGGWQQESRGLNDADDVTYDEHPVAVGQPITLTDIDVHDAHSDDTDSDNALVDADADADRDGSVGADHDSEDEDNASEDDEGDEPVTYDAPTDTEDGIESRGNGMKGDMKQEDNANKTPIGESAAAAKDINSIDPKAIQRDPTSYGFDTIPTSPPPAPVPAATSLNDSPAAAHPETPSPSPTSAETNFKQTQV